MCGRGGGGRERGWCQLECMDKLFLTHLGGGGGGSNYQDSTCTLGVIDWRMWIECEQAVWFKQQWPNRTKQGCSTQNVRISYTDSVKAVQERQSPFPLPVCRPVWSDSTPSTPTLDSIRFGQTFTLTQSPLAWDLPNRSIMP